MVVAKWARPYPSDSRQTRLRARWVIHEQTNSSETAQYHFYCFPLVSLFFVGVHDEGKVPRVAVLLFGFLLILGNGTLVDLPSLQEQLT